MLYLMVWML